MRKYDEESVFCLRKKRSHLLKLHLYQIGKALNLPVVGGRLFQFYSACVRKLFSFTFEWD